MKTFLKNLKRHLIKANLISAVIWGIVFAANVKNALPYYPLWVIIAGHITAFLFTATVLLVFATIMRFIVPKEENVSTNRREDEDGFEII